MGFPHDAVYSALASAGWVEAVAINNLLGIDSAPTQPPPTVQNQPPKSSGGFWGRKP
jgi:hypothetical protein